MTEFAMILAAENAADGTTALIDGSSSLTGSCPHLAPEQRSELARHLIGFVTWPEAVTRFGLSQVRLPLRVRR